MALYNLARVATATVGTGTITLGAAINGFLTFGAAGVPNGATISYGVSDGNNSEMGTGVYSTTGPTLTRVVTTSTNANSAISLSGSAQVFITPRAQDIVDPTTLGTASTHPQDDFIRVDTSQALSTSLQSQGRLNAGINQAVAIGAIDLNTVTAPGSYYSTAAPSANSPVGGLQWFLEVVIYGAVGAGFLMQRATNLANTAEIYTRTNFNGTWGVWRRISYASDPATPKAWVKFSGVTTITMGDSYNIASVVRTTTGGYTITFTTAFANANYAFTYAILFNTGGHAQFMRVATVSTTTVVITCLDNTFNPADTDGLSMAFFGTQ